MLQRILLCLMLCAGVAQAQLYRSTDADGNVTYTDVPPGESAEEVTLPPVNVIDPIAVPPTLAKEAPAPSIATYVVAISSPGNGETLRNQAETIVSVEVIPELGKAHRVAISLDGELVAQGRESRFALPEVTRGEHTLVALVIDSRGRRLAASAPVRVHVKRHSVLH